MNDNQYRVFLDLMMVSDPWPLEKADGEILTRLADNEANRRGYENWIVAYHEHLRGERYKVQAGDLI